MCGCGVWESVVCVCVWCGVDSVGVHASTHTQVQGLYARCVVCVIV